MKKPFAAPAVLAALATACTLFTAVPASASTSPAGQVCRYAPIHADGEWIYECIQGDSGNGLQAGAYTANGTNNTTINLCVQIVNAVTGATAGNPSCATVSGENSGSASPFTPQLHLPDGQYVAHAYFTTPTYFDGGESGRMAINSTNPQ